MQEYTVHYVTRDGRYVKETIGAWTIAATPYSYRDGGIADLIEFHVSDPSEFWVTKKGSRKPLSTQDLDKIRDAEIADEQRRATYER